MVDVIIDVIVDVMIDAIVHVPSVPAPYAAWRE
jgi:hypothetical protein